MSNAQPRLPEGWNVREEIGLSYDDTGMVNMKTLLVDLSGVKNQFVNERLMVVKQCISMEHHSQLDQLLLMLSQCNLTQLPRLEQFWQDAQGNRYLSYPYRVAQQLGEPEQFRTLGSLIEFCIVLTDTVIRLHQAGVVHGQLNEEHILVADGEPYLVGFGRLVLRHRLWLSRESSPKRRARLWEDELHRDVTALGSLFHRQLYSQLSVEQARRCSELFHSGGAVLEKVLVQLASFVQADPSTRFQNSIETVPGEQEAVQTIKSSAVFTVFQQLIPISLADWLTIQFSKWRDSHNRSQHKRYRVIKKFMLFCGVAIGTLIILSTVLGQSESNVSIVPEDSLLDAISTEDTIEQFSEMSVNTGQSPTQAAIGLMEQFAYCLNHQSLLCLESIMVSDSALLPELRQSLADTELHWSTEILLSGEEPVDWGAELREEYGDIALVTLFMHEKTSRLDLVLQRGLSGWLIRAMYLLDS